MSSYNDIYKKIIVLTGYTSQEIRAALDAAGYPVSRSRLSGWACSPENRHFYRMTDTDITAVLDALISYEREGLQPPRASGRSLMGTES